jgi:hypothetical protein
MAAVMLCWWWLWAMEVESWWKKMAGVCLLIKGQSIGCRCVERNADIDGQLVAWLEQELRRRAARAEQELADFH